MADRNYIRAYLWVFLTRKRFLDSIVIKCRDVHVRSMSSRTPKHNEILWMLSISILPTNWHNIQFQLKTVKNVQRFEPSEDSNTLSRELNASARKRNCIFFIKFYGSYTYLSFVPIFSLFQFQTCFLLLHTNAYIFIESLLINNFLRIISKHFVYFVSKYRNI